jgi:hypothetical protein
MCCKIANACLNKNIMNIKMTAKNLLLYPSVILAFFIGIGTGLCQTVTNGNFDGTSTGWTSCISGSPEVINTVECYNGASGCTSYGTCGAGCTKDYIGETDNGNSNGLCQTVTGLTSGGTFPLYFSFARRNNDAGNFKSPATVHVDVCFTNTTTSAQVCTTLVATGELGTTGFTAATWNFTNTLGSTSLQLSVKVQAADYGGGCSCSDNYGMVFQYVSFNSPTPIRLLSFDAMQNGEGVDLAWQTATEINNDYFIVEKSKNGIDFIAIDSIKGAGTSHELLSYQTTDRLPYNEISYYRLKQVDYDGTVSYSKIEAVNSNGNNNITVYPNPGTGIFHILGLNAKTEISVQNPLGQVVLIKKVFSDSSEIDLSCQPSGVYYIKVNSGDAFTYNEKIIIYR